MKITVVILAAGQGTRMHSNTPKVLHLLAGQPLIRYSLQAAAGVGTEVPVVVIGHESEQVRQMVGKDARFVVQDPQLGTGHAVRTAESLLAGQTDLVLVISADMPLLSGDTLRRMVSVQQANPGPMTMLTILSDDSHGFGRVIRAADGTIREIVEEAQAAPEQLAMRELNVGAYCFQASWLWNALKRVPLSPKGEYYLTDTVGLASADGLPVQAFALEDDGEALGINTRIHLAEAVVGGGRVVARDCGIELLRGGVGRRQVERLLGRLEALCGVGLRAGFERGARVGRRVHGEQRGE